MKNKTVAIILAGGKSERMGVAKGLLKYGKTFWILEQINRLGKCGIQTVFIGLGHDFEHYFREIDWFKKASKDSVNFMGIEVKVIINPSPTLGSFSTLQSVLKKIDSTINVLVNPVDIPCLDKEELAKILNSNMAVCIPQYKQKNGHPIKLKAIFWNSLLDLNPSHYNSRLDLQIKQLDKDLISYVAIDNDSILKNLNTPREWKLFLKDS